MTDKEAVEAVARLVDPEAFVMFDNLYEHCLLKGDDEKTALETAEWAHGRQCDKARIKAREIIAAARPFLLEEAARIAERAHQGPAPCSDGDTYICGSNMDAAAEDRCPMMAGSGHAAPDAYVPKRERHTPPEQER